MPSGCSAMLVFSFSPGDESLKTSTESEQRTARSTDALAANLFVRTRRAGSDGECLAWEELRGMSGWWRGREAWVGHGMCRPTCDAPLTLPSQQSTPSRPLCNLMPLEMMCLLTDGYRCAVTATLAPCPFLSLFSTYICPSSHSLLLLPPLHSFPSSRHELAVRRTIV